MGLVGRDVFKAYDVDRFTSDASYARFARNTVKMLGLLNPIESHALLYESVTLREEDVRAEDRSYGCPQILTDIGLANIGLCWMDPAAIREQFGLSFFSMSEFRKAFERPFLCDPHYGLSIFPHEGRWIHSSFTMDWLPKRQAASPDDVRFYLDDPSRILSDEVLPQLCFGRLCSTIKAASNFLLPCQRKFGSIVSRSFVILPLPSHLRSMLRVETVESGLEDKARST